MSTYKVIGCVVGLWVTANIIAFPLFTGLSASSGYAAVFSWWFVAYFTRDLSVDWFGILSLYAVVFLILVLIKALGFYGYIYHDAPSGWPLAFLMVMGISSAFIISPILFNKLVVELKTRIKWV
jgi:hypothetical protein